MRKEWDAYDVTTPEGIKVEVKSAAYIQSWHQEKPSQVSFGIAPTTDWDEKTNTWGTEKKRQADVYVFALLDNQDQGSIDPLDLEQWRFLVLAARVLNEKKLDAQSIGLAAVRKLGPIETSVEGLPDAVTACADP